MSRAEGYVQEIIALGTVTVLTGTNTSTAIDNVGTSASAIVLPAAMDSATCTFLVSADEVGIASAVFHPLVDSAGLLIQQTFLASQAFALSPAAFWQWRYLKIVVDTNESADRVLTVVRRVL